MKNKLSLLFILFSFITNIALADVLQHTLDDLNCPTTPQIIDLKPQPEVANTNNLRRFAGHPDVASGDLILIRGQVLDSNCVPVPDATVEIWQADSVGNMLLDSDFELNHEYDPHFVGSGKFLTDNLGNYSFLTVMPGSLGEKDAPHINFLIKHRDFLPLETKMYFENQSLNQQDHLLNKYVSAKDRDYLIAKTAHSLESSGDDIMYKFNITLEGANKYLRY